MMKQKKIPLRMCAGCGEMKPKKELVRVVRAPVKEIDGAQVGGEVSLDLTGRKPGRGAYVCRNPECLKRAIKQRQLERQLEVQLTEEVAQALQDTIVNLPAQEAE